MTTHNFEPRADAVRAARYFATAEAAGWGLDSVDLAIVVGELAANAFRHAGTDFSVSVTYLEGHLGVEVSDGSRSLPVTGSRRATSPRGHGLALVTALALAWGARPATGGKVVWAELPAIKLGPDGGIVG